MGRVHRPSGVPPTAAISLHRLDLALGANWRHHAVSRVTGFTAANASLSQRTAPPK
jgi:hypothetical protein